MKKLLSVTLAVMLFAGLFVVNASAVVPVEETVIVIPAVPQNDLVVQDYSDAENNLEFTKIYSSLGVAELSVDPTDELNPVMKLTTEEKGMLQSDATKADIDEVERKMTVEFRVYPVGQAETIHVGNRMPILLAGTDDYDGKARENFYVIGHPNFVANQWNTVKVEFHIPESYSVTNVSYPEYGNESSATITVNGTVLACVPGSAGKTATAGKYGVQANFSGGTKPQEIEELTYIAIGGVGAPAVTETGRTVYIDDIKVYVPAVAEVTEDVAYPITKGNIYLTHEESVVIEGYDGTTSDDKGAIKFEVSGEAAEYVLTFDAKNTVQGMPLTIHFGDKAHVGAVSIASSETTGTEWNTYKVPFKVSGNYVNPQKVFKLNEDGTYTNLTFNVDWHSNRSGSTTKNTLVFYYKSDIESKLPAPEGSDITKSTWEVKNIQVTDIMTYTGKALVADATLNVNLNTCISQDASIIVAVFDGDRMVSAQAVDIAAYDADAEIVVPYVETIEKPAVKIFVLNGMDTMVPMDIPVIITDAVQ